MDDFNDVERPLSCGYCDYYLGILEEILKTNKLNEHKCLSHFENVTVDNQNGKVFGTRSENVSSRATKEDASCSGMVAGCSKDPDLMNKMSTTDLPSEKNFEIQETREGTIWTNEVTKLLISTYKANMLKFESPLYNKKQVWNLISEKLKKKNVIKSGDKCNEKWRNLKKTYEKVLKDKNTTGNSPVYWKFFDAMHEIYLTDPHFNPVFTMSTTGLCKKRTSSTSSEDKSDEINEMSNVNDDTHKENPQKNINKNDTGKSKSKSKKPRYTETELEDRKQQRHEEKLQLKKEMFEWFKENFKKE